MRETLLLSHYQRLLEMCIEQGLKEEAQTVRRIMDKLKLKENDKIKRQT
tara:strand:+ start:273 stop:419 length:147 start_codon:yes stop_codon:yes gene_type:complete